MILFMTGYREYIYIYNPHNYVVPSPIICQTKKNMCPKPCVGHVVETRTKVLVATRPPPWSNRECDHYSFAKMDMILLSLVGG